MKEPKKHISARLPIRQVDALQKKENASDEIRQALDAFWQQSKTTCPQCAGAGWITKKEGQHD